MRTKTIYVSFDGIEFDDELKCEKYEHKMIQEQYANVLTVYDKNGETIDLYDDYLVNNISQYIVCKNKEALNYINKIFESNGYSTIDVYQPTFPSSYYYDDCTESWIDIAETVTVLQGQIDKLKKYIV